MESPRMGPNLHHKPATPNRKTSHTRTSQSRKTSHTRISQSRKTSHPRTTRSSLFPLIIIHVRRYGESSRGPLPPQGSRLPECACLRLPACACTRLPGQTRCTELGRKTGRQGDREDSPTHRAGQVARGHLLTLPALPRLPTLPTPPAYPACLPCLPCPVSRLSRVCHIVNRSVTRAPCKTAFCQAILLFLDLSKRYALIHNNLHAH